jgi:hypothetical protein
VDFDLEERSAYLLVELMDLEKTCSIIEALIALKPGNKYQNFRNTETWTQKEEHFFVSACDRPERFAGTMAPKNVDIIVVDEWRL